MTTATPIGFRASGNAQQLVGIPIGLRLQHTHVVGNAGTGKSTLIGHMVLHDIQAGYGVAVIDPHGSLVERLLSLIPRGHTDRVICLNPGERDWVPVWNPLRHRTPASPALITDALTHRQNHFRNREMEFRANHARIRATSHIFNCLGQQTLEADFAVSQAEEISFGIRNLRFETLAPARSAGV